MWRRDISCPNAYGNSLSADQGAYGHSYVDADRDSHTTANVDSHHQAGGIDVDAWEAIFDGDRHSDAHADLDPDPYAITDVQPDAVVALTDSDRDMDTVTDGGNTGAKS